MELLRKSALASSTSLVSLSVQFHCHSFQPQSPGGDIEIPYIYKLSDKKLHKKDVRDLIGKVQYYS